MVDLTPTTTGYIRILRLIVDRSTNELDVRWAKEELNKLGVKQ